MNSNNTEQPQLAKKLMLKKERITVLSAPQAAITSGSFSPTATCNC